MSNRWLGSAGALILLVAGPAVAADMPLKAPAVVAARQAVRIRWKSGAGQRLGEDRAHNRFAVYKYAIAIEDDHGSLRCVGHADWPPFKLFKLTVVTIANGCGMQRPSSRAAQFMHRNRNRIGKLHTREGCGDRRLS